MCPKLKKTCKKFTEFHRFSDGRKSVKDDPCSGRKVTVSMDERIAAIEV